MKAALSSSTAWVIWIVSLVLLGVGTVFGNVDADELAFPLAALCFASVGLLIRVRQPVNPIGWVFVAAGLLVAMEAAADSYTIQARGSGLSHVEELVAWMGSIAFLPLFGLIGALFLLFPNGRPPSRRWRMVGGMGTAAMVMATSGLAVRVGPLEDVPWLDNPVGVTGTPGDVMKFIGDFGAGLLFACILAAGVSLLFRTRWSRGEERLQIKWFAYASAMAAAIFMIASVAYSQGGENQPLLDLLVGLGFAAIPVAAGIAILKYRLYDIDLLVNRTLVYGVLTASLAVTYLATVILLESLVPGSRSSDLAVAGSTLAVAALFRPARARIQSFIDRRFYRRKFDAAQTLEAFSARMRDEIDLESLKGELVEVVQKTMQPTHASLWLQSSSESEVSR